MQGTWEFTDCPWSLVQEETKPWFKATQHQSEFHIYDTLILLQFEVWQTVPSPSDRPVCHPSHWPKLTPKQTAAQLYTWRSEDLPYIPCVLCIALHSCPPDSVRMSPGTPSMQSLLIIFQVSNTMRLGDSTSIPSNEVPCTAVNA